MLGVNSNPFSPSNRSSLVASRLTMARDQMNGIFQPGDPASGLDLACPLLEQTLLPRPEIERRCVAHPLYHAIY